MGQGQLKWDKSPHKINYSNKNKLDRLRLSKTLTLKYTVFIILIVKLNQARIEETMTKAPFYTLFQIITKKCMTGASVEMNKNLIVEKKHLSLLCTFSKPILYECLLPKIALPARLF